MMHLRVFLAAVGCVHYRRARAPQAGRELAYQHAHFRFLGYLRANVRLPALRELLASYQRNIAEIMHLPLSSDDLPM